MKQRLIYLLAGILFFSQSLIGQSLPENLCGTKLDSATIEHLNKLEPAIQQRINFLQSSPGDETESLVTIPIKFYIVRESSGSGGLQASLLNTILSNLNSKFSGTGFYFSQCGPTEYIDNSTLYNFDQSEESMLVNAAYTPGAVNMYFTNTLTDGNAGLNGYAYFPGTSAPDIIVVKNAAATTSTTPHEAGHFFGLYHTHGKVNCGPMTDELVNGCNCKNHGDNVCDTPADPGLQGIDCSGYLVNGCVYSNTVLKDANQQVFAPMVSNLMSYAPDVCRTQFTQGQKDRMVAQYQLYRSYLACPATCSQPILVFTSFITHNAARLIWSPTSGALGHEAQIRIANGTWSPLNLTASSGNFVEINNLLPATSYQCRMRTICENGKSLWKESSVFTTLSPCNTPTNLTTTDINDQSVKFNWAAVSGAQSYSIEVRAIGSPYWNKSVSTTLTSYTFLCTDGTYISSDRGLGSNTQYEWRIRTYCSSGLYSDWSSPVPFTTAAAACNSPLPSDIVVVSVTSSSVTVKCTKTAYRYQFRRSPGGFQTDASSSNIYTFSADPCTTYEIQCLVRCQSGGPYSRYSASQFVATPGCSSCNVPAALTTASTTHSSATLNWSSASGALNYSVQWRLAGGAWSSLPPGTFSGTSATVTNLQPGTAYSWRIKSNCSNSQSSGWSSAVPANTGPAPCATPLGLKTIGVLQNTATFLWAAQSGINSYTLQYWFAGGAVQETQVTGTSKTVFNLSPNTTYQWKLRANCGSNQSSTWKTGTSFATLPINSLSASPSTQNVGYNAGSTTISVSSNIAWEAVVASGGSWLSICPSSGQSNGSITATFTANGNTTSRTATVSITGSGITKTVSIVQAGNPNPNCSNDNEPANNTLPGASTIALNTDKLSQIGSNTDIDYWKFTLATVQNINVTLTTLPADYELQVYNSAGVLLGSSTAGGTSNESITLDNQAAGNYFARVYGFNGNYSTTQCYTLKVITSAANILTLAPASQNVGAGAGNASFTVTSNVSWTATDNATWLTLSPTSGSNNGTLTASFSANTTSSPRSVTITVTGGGTTQTATLVQAGIATTLIVSPATKNVGSAAGSETFSVTSNVTWTVTDDATWLTVSPAVGSNNATLTASFSANTSSSSRTATITVTGGGITQTATLVQAGAPASCAAATGLQTTSITQNTATLSWNSTSGAVSYTVQFFWNGAWLVIGTTTALSMGVYGLVPNSSYQWRLITNCANNQQSSPSATVTFDTPIVLSNCTGGTQWPSTALTPAANWQLQDWMYGGDYSVVNVQSGVTYTFSYCSADGGVLAFDGQISVRTMDDQLLSYSDDICDFTAPKTVWQSNFTGQVRVLLTKYNCLTQATNSTMAYRIGNSFAQDEIEVRSEVSFFPLPPHDSQVFIPYAAAVPSVAQLKPAAELGISIFPNPSSGIFNIRIEPQPMVERFFAQVLDQLGRVLWSGYAVATVEGTDLAVDASSWANGTYTVSILASDGRSVERKIQLQKR